MSSENYAALARLRCASAPDGYLQPEDFGYDFREWVSPYTKLAHRRGGLALVLQDWASAKKLEEGVLPSVQRDGRFASLRTNRTLDTLLQDVCGISIEDTYVTNVFPYIKPGSMSANIPLSLIRNTASIFTKAELGLARPTKILAFGKRAQHALAGTGTPFIALPHPVARGLSLDGHRQIWRRELARRPRADA